MIRRPLSALCALACAGLIGSPHGRADSRRQPSANVALGKGWIGVALAERVGKGTRVEVAVTAVLAGSPAAASGLRRGDVILKLDRLVIRSSTQLIAAVSGRRPGTQVRLLLRRGGKKVSQQLLLGARPSARGLIRRRYLGKPAPALFARRVSDGSPVRLSALRGKVVLIDFWATWCGPCRVSLPLLDRLAVAYKGKKVAIIGISTEPPALLRRFLIRRPLHYTIAADRRRRTSAAYLISALPTMVIVDRRGVVRELFFGIGSLAKLAPTINRLLRAP